MVKKAVSLIELVIAIVILGLAVSAMPLFISQSTNANAFSLKQEAILGAQTKLGNLLAYSWDENSYDSGSDTHEILQTQSTNYRLKERKGLTGKAGRSILSAKYASNIKKEGNNNNDIDDFDGTEDKIKESAISAALSNAERLDYLFKDDLSFKTEVGYLDDTNINFSKEKVDFVFSNNINNTSKTKSTNIKMVKLITRIKDQKDIILYAYIFNIGQSGKPQSKDFAP